MAPESLVMRMWMMLDQTRLQVVVVVAMRRCAAINLVEAVADCWCEAADPMVEHRRRAEAEADPSPASFWKITDTGEDSTRV